MSSSGKRKILLVCSVILLEALRLTLEVVWELNQVNRFELQIFRNEENEKSPRNRMIPGAVAGFSAEKIRNQRLEFLLWCFTAFYIVCNAHFVGYCEGVIAYRLIFFVLSHRMLHQISTKLTPRLTPVLFDKLEFVLLSNQFEFKGLCT